MQWLLQKKNLYGKFSSLVGRALFFPLCAAFAAATFASIASADANPTQLVLLYMPNISNTGSQQASGVAELVMSEGEVRIQAADLPRLDGDQQYVAWVVNTHTNDFLKLGNFNTAQSTGAVDYENVEPDAIPDKSWDLLLVTVEATAGADHPSNQHSIAATFPNTDNQALPGILPNTGGSEDAHVISCEPSAISCSLSALDDHLSVVSQSEWMVVSVPGALMLAITFGAGYGLGHKRR
jgi:Anti-sigma-K factor rskA, C-terminal